MQRTLKEGTLRGLEYILLRSDGSEFPGELSAGIMSDYSNNPTSFIAISRDITERKRAEEFILTQSEVARNMTEGAYIVGLHDTIIRYANPKFENMFGYEPGEMIGKHASIVNAPTDLSPEARADEIMEVIRRTGEWHGEVNNIKKDGTRFWCYANVSTFNHPVFGDVLLAVHSDITEHKRAEEALKISLREKDILLREVHHRVKNNLQVVSSLLDLYSRQTDVQKELDICTKARSKIHSMAIIHAQLYAGETFKSVDLKNYIMELVSFLCQLHKEDRTITPDIEVGDVRIDITQAVPYAIVLNEVVTNALIHAFQGREKGIIKISVERLADGAILTTVKDDGIGLSQEFDIDKVDTMGLKLVKNVVEQQLKGEISLKRDKGTEATIEFNSVKEVSSV